MSLISEVRSELKLVDESPRTLRKFSLLFVLINSFGIYFSIRHDYEILLYACSITGVYSTAGLIYPAVIRPFHKGWMFTSLLLGWVVSRNIIIILFYFVITPFSIIAKLSGKHFLDLNFRSNEKSYWKKKDNSKLKDYRKIF